jgi:F-type H+-transporting ATPase subunit a
MPKDKIFETMDHIFSAITVGIVLFFIALNVYIKLRNVKQHVIPSKGITLINIVDIFYEYLLSFMESVIENNPKKHINFVGSIALFVLFSNLLGLIPGFTSSTNNLNTTVACGFAVFCYFNYHGFKVNGLQHIGHLANPLNMWWGWFLSPFFFFL